MKTKYHRDGTVTVWDVYAQTWRERVSPSSILGDAQFMGTLDSHERARIEAMNEGSTLREQKRLARRIIAAADEGGTIQATKMLELTSRPRAHTTCSIETALELCGAKWAAQDL